ncbi:DUF3775 domain-containing protein [Bacillus mycoides]|uniref:DUF3775 domain-containing protein n=1 Tax=Bacillus mycoides TaxID=1405 RepID=UPI000864293B|nr:DUF3775 domain-containing protein [Bacillus mycoides]SCM88432.1 Uncharacterized protein BWAI21_03890 [Bacillus mycoides]
MFKELSGVFEDVIKLARDHRLYYEKQHIGSTPKDIIEFRETPEGKELARRKKLLNDYLNQLDFEVVKTIQVIMYLGRNRDYDEQDLPEEIYRKQRESFDKHIGWNEKRIEINQITQKVPLDQYLENGLNILGVRLALN